MSRPLTPALMRERTSALFDQILAGLRPEDGPVEEVVFEIITCDRCGLTHNLLTGPPEGWTTEGDLDRGFTDLCRSCSQ